MLRNSAALGLPLVLLAACLLTQVATFSTVPITLRKSSSLDASPLASLYRRGFQPSLHRDARRAPALKMQWKEGAEQLPFQPKWEAFQAYNMGRWKGKSLHISPFTGDYIEPFSSDHVLDIVELEDGVQTATERMTLGDDTAPRMSESVITINDDFQCSDDGSYSQDKSFVSVPDLDATARFCVEISLVISNSERVRCLAMYDFESKLSRLILYEEDRVVSTGAQRLIGIKFEEEKAKSTRGPLTLLSAIGEFRGEAAGMRTSRLGGGRLQFTSRGGTQYDGQGRVRTEMQLVDERKRTSRRVLWGDVASPVESAVSLEEGYRLVFLPSGCWVVLPEKLEAVVEAVAKAEEAATPEAAPAPAEGGEVGEESVKRALEAAFAGKGTGAGEDVVNIKSFSVEFGCFLDDNTRKRTVRLYNTDGRLASSTTVVEKRTDGESTATAPMYDSFD